MRCNFLSAKVDPLLPIFICPDDMSQDEYIDYAARKGLDEHMHDFVYRDDMTPEERLEIDKRYYERLEYELSVIKKWAFPAIS